ncbi:RNA-binding protein, partial [Streptomyces sp. SID9124]|nr:RNA-binding protein [Streptomyces sp. SID9124]
MVEQPEGGAASADGADDAVEALDRPLPEGVRRRVVALVSDAFGGLTVAELPAQLRQYARFTASRRAKFAGNAMAAALANDAQFRRRIGDRLREAQPELAAALESGAPP